MAALVPLKAGLKLTAWPVSSRRIKVAIDAVPVRSSKGCPLYFLNIFCRSN